MGQAQGIIADILGKISCCELCEAPPVSVDALEIYTIGTCDSNDLSGMANNIIVLCPSCKKKYDSGIISRKHLKACVMLRAPETGEWMNGLFERYGIGARQSNVKKGLIDRSFYNLVNNQASLNNLIFVSCIFIMIIGVLLFSIGYQSSGSIDTASTGTAGGTGSPVQGLFSPLMELSGVALSLIGLFFLLGMEKKPSSPGK